MFQFVYICPLFKYFSVLYCIFSSDFLAIWSDFTDLPGIAVRGTPFPYHRLCSRTRHSIFNDPQTFLRTFSDFAHFCFMTRSLWSRPYFPMSVTLYISLHLQVDPHPFLFESPAGMHLYSLLYLIDLSSDPLQFEWSLTTSSSCPYNCPFRKFIFLYLSTWSASGHVPSFCGFFFGFIAQNGLHSFFCIWPYKCSIIFSNVLLHFSYIVFWYFGYFIRFHSSACWETAVFMHFDGPSVPSENCCSSWFSITFLFQKNLLLYIFLWFFVYFLIFYRILLVYTSGIACLGHSPICQLQQRHYICPMYDLNQTTVRSVAVASVDFDGPLVPSENSYLFIFCLHFFHIFQYIFLWFFGYFFTKQLFVYILSPFFSYFSIYFSLIFWLFFHILLNFVPWCGWNCLFRKCTLPYLSTSTETLYLSNIWINSEVCGRRNSSISGFWWANSAIRELLSFNHHSFSEKPVPLYFFLIFWLFYWILLLYVSGIACLGNLHSPYLSTSTGTIYLSNVWLGSINCEVWGKGNSRISEFWWAISHIKKLLHLLLLNHWANLFGLCGLLIY